MTRGRIAFVLGTALLVHAAGVAGQIGLPAERPGSTRAMGMGDAYMLGAPRPDALFYNPAVIDSTSGIGASLERIVDGPSLVSAVAATRWWKGGVALGARAYGSGQGTLSAGLGYAMPVHGFRTGIAAHYVEASSTDRGWSVDIGLAHRAGPLTLGVAALTLGPDLARAGELPTRYRLDAALPRRQLGPLDIAAAAMAGLDRGGDGAAGAGVEVGWWPVVGRTFIARAGLRYDQRVVGREVWPTLGASFEGNAIVLEYGWERHPGGPSVNRFGVAFR